MGRSFSNIEPYIFWALLFVHLFPILSNQYFLTGDGPSHVYNAKVVLDHVQGNDWDFYSEYYTFNTYPEPNWASHFLLAGLLLVFPDFLAEKILLIFYVIAFAYCWRLLIRQINPQNSFIALLGLPFIFHRTFQMGFYNYSLSFVLMFWVLAYWLKYREELKGKRLIMLGTSFLLLYFCHPVGLTLSWTVMGFLLLCGLLLSSGAENERFSEKITKTLRSGLTLTFASFPALLLLGIYMIRRGTETTPNPFTWAHMGRKLVELTSLVNMTRTEVNWAIAWAILCGLLLIVGVFYKIKQKKFSQYDGFFLAFLLALLMYFIQPGSIGGAGILYIRLQFIPYLMLILWLASIPFSDKIAKRILFPAVIIPLALLTLRAPHHRLASEAVQEYLSVREHIPNRSTVLPLSFAHQGLTPEGAFVANRIWLYMHAADYLGSDRSLVMLGNYEAGLGYFPIVWKEDKQPFFHIATNEGIEGRPPSVDLLSYKQKTGGSIDYVLTWCLDNPEFADHPNTQSVNEQLAKGYEWVFSSENGLAKLFKRKEMH